MRFNSVTSFAFTILFLSIHLQAYNPVDRFTISCGATGKSFDGERTWIGDTDLNLLFHEDNTVSANATTQSPLTNQVPFTTARLSRSQFNYSFPVTAGPKFLRLFFYPASYPSFLRTEASFAVHSNQFTLLNSFNASLNAEDIKTIFREYVVNVDNGESLNLSFTPSQPNSYAFINGIEVLSMPSDLYYTSANDTAFKLMGSDALYSVRTNTALETEYRINVGGQGISPRNDTGLFRNWAGHDDDYLIKQNNQQINSLLGDLDGMMNITVNPDYVAPKELYKTARDTSTNTNNTLKKSLKLIWEFPVDCGFYYMVRLHFCKLYPNTNNTGDGVFSIYLGSELADVMRWSQRQKGLTVQTNYVVLFPKNETQNKVNLSVQIHPYGSNPFLNGIEIFKISQAGSNNLAGPNPQNNIPVQKRKKSITRLKIVVAGVVSCVVLVLLVVFFIVFPWASSMCLTTKSTNTKNYALSTIRQDFGLLYLRLSLVEIKATTNNFDDAFMVGTGGFGPVYRGNLAYDGISITVAIKRLKQGSKQGDDEFLNEIEMLSQLRHRNLVSLIGYCNINKEKILVYRFMSRGNLRDHLYNTGKPPLSWEQRLQICIGAAQGLHYLHKCAGKYTIIHSDVKTTNILLDDEWVAKVSDFGLSRIGPKDSSKDHVSTTAVKGSFGYLDPEYCKLQHLTEKSDVYSFGVVLFEVLCARPPLIQTTDPNQESLANWVRYCYHSGTLEQIVDPELKGRITPECFRMFCEIGLSCLREVGMQRPSMKHVVGMLELALQLQHSAAMVLCKEKLSVRCVHHSDSDQNANKTYLEACCAGHYDFYKIYNTIINYYNFN